MGPHHHATYSSPAIIGVLARSFSVCTEPLSSRAPFSLGIPLHRPSGVLSPARLFPLAPARSLRPAHLPLSRRSLGSGLLRDPPCPLHAGAGSFGRPSPPHPQLLPSPLPQPRAGRGLVQGSRGSMGLLGLLSSLHSAFFRDQVGRGVGWGGFRPWEQLEGADRGDSGPGARGRKGLRTQT